jgi:lipoate-protein ligase B
LTPFSWIQPCGLQDIGMTSMQQESAQTLSMQQVRAVIKKQFEVVFGIKFTPQKLADLDAILEKVALTSSV